jgi:hypothetical protein
VVSYKEIKIIMICRGGEKLIDKKYESHRTIAANPRLSAHSGTKT